MYEMDGVVYAGIPETPISVKQVQAKSDYTLQIRFSTGEQKVFNATLLIEKGGVFARLSDMNLFLQAHVDYGTVVWGDTLDIAPEYLYDNSQSVGRTNIA